MFWLNILKSFITCCAVSLMYVLWSLCFLGRGLARAEGRRDTGAHRLYAYAAFGLSAVIVIAVLASKVLFPEHHYPLLFSRIHRYVFAMPFFVLVCLICSRITGERYPRMHKWVAYPCLTLGFCTAILGIALLATGR
jgi:hypothetical protein